MNKKFYRTIGFYLFLVTAVMVGILLFQLLSLNVLPMQFFVLGSLILILLVLLFYFISVKWKVLGNILLCFFIVLSSIGNIYLYKTNHLFNSISESDQDFIEFSVVSLKDHSDELQSLGILSVGDVENQGKALDLLDTSYDCKKYDSYANLGEALYNEEVDAILLANHSFEFMEETYPSFSKDIEVIKKRSSSCYNKIIRFRIRYYQGTVQLIYFW